MSEQWHNGHKAPQNIYRDYGHEAVIAVGFSNAIARQIVEDHNCVERYRAALQRIVRHYDEIHAQTTEMRVLEIAMWAIAQQALEEPAQ